MVTKYLCSKPSEIHMRRKLVVFRCFQVSFPSEKIEMQLYSCNATGVCADVTLTFVNQINARRSQSSEGKLVSFY